MPKSTSAGRMKRLRASRKVEEGYDEEGEKEKERKRIGRIRERQKVEREKDIVLQVSYRERRS